MFENASAVCLRGSIRDAVPAPYARTRAAGHPATLTRAEHIQWDGTQLRQALNRQIVDLAGRGVPIKTMARTTGASCQTFRKILSGQRHDTFWQRQSALDAWSLTLEAEWNAGCRVGSELWRRLKASGFTGRCAWSANGPRAAAVSSPWASGQVEGKITRLKSIKCQMYGRAKIDLLKARFMVPA